VTGVPARLPELACANTGVPVVPSGRSCCRRTCRTTARLVPVAVAVGPRGALEVHSAHGGAGLAHVVGAIALGSSGRAEDGGGMSAHGLCGGGLLRRHGLEEIC